MDHREPIYVSVVPRAGTWIETALLAEQYDKDFVVPRAGTWIETSETSEIITRLSSFPVRERGLKHIMKLAMCC